MDTGPITTLTRTPPDIFPGPPARKAPMEVLGVRLPGPLLLVGACVVLAHLPYLLGWFDPNPLLQQSGLGLDMRRGLVSGSDTIDPNAGFTSQTLAHRAILDWFHGQLPWWNPYEGLGSPLAGELQGAALFFPFVLLLFFANGQVLLYLILCLIAAYSTYFLLQKLSLPPWACFAGAVAFGLNGTFAWFRFAPSNPVCFLPLMLLGIEIVRERARQHRRTHWWIIAVALALSILAGFPETAYLDGLLALLWTLVRLRGLLRQQARRCLLAVAGGVVSGALLAAPILVAFLDYLPSASLANNSANLSHTYLPTHGVDTLFFPYVYGPIFGLTSGRGAPAVGGVWARVGGYLTVALVLLAVFGLIGGLMARELRALKIALAAWSLLLVGRSYGTTVLANLLGLIPGLSHVLTFRYMNPSVSLAVTVLAAFGVRDVLERRTDRTPLLVGTGLVTVVAVLAAKNAHELSRTVLGAAGWEEASWAWGFGTILLVAAVVGSARFRRLGMVAIVALLPVEAVVMFVVPELSAPRSGHVDRPLVAFLEDHIGLDRFATLGPFEPNYGSYFGIASLNENDLPVPKDFGRLVTTTLDPNTNPVLFTGNTSTTPNGLSPEAAFVKYARTYQELGVKYLLTFADDTPTNPPGMKLTEVYQDSLVAVYQLPGTAPYFQDSPPTCALVALSQEQVRADCSRPSTLVRDELEMPGWTARDDGRASRLGSSRLFQQTLSLPTGQQTISYNFEPPHMSLAWLSVVLGVVACAVSAGIVPWRTSRRTRRNSQRQGSGRGLAANGAGVLVGAQPLEAGMAETAVGGPLGERDGRDQFGPSPMGTPDRDRVDER
jgi:hypothetical protein